MQKTIYLINPQSNEKNAIKQWQQARHLNKNLPQEPTDITKIDNLRGYIQQNKPKLIVIAGGDGTVNRVCDAILPLEQKPFLAILPLGYGNALSYCFGVDTIQKAMKVIHGRSQTITIDIFTTTIPQIPVGIFGMGVGFDGQIVHTRMHNRYIGMRSYIISTIIRYLTHVQKKITLTIDHSVTLTSTVSSLVITNAPIIGKNFILAENAKLNDGLLDCILFSSQYAYMTNLRMRGFKHPLYSDHNKVFFSAKHIRIDGEHYAQIDGDPVLFTKSIEIQIVPKAITFLRNEDSQIPLESLPYIV